MSSCFDSYVYSDVSSFNNDLDLKNDDNDLKKNTYIENLVLLEIYITATNWLQIVQHSFPSPFSYISSLVIHSYMSIARIEIPFIL